MCEVRRIIIGVSDSVIPCVGAVVTDEQGRLLMIKRGHEPGAGLWSIPGGRIEPGETDAEALAREMLEETGLTVEVGRLVGTVQRPGPGGAILDIRDYAATVIGGTLAAADDAADARWVRAEDLNALPLTEGLADILTSWGVLGQERQLSSYFSAYNLAVLFDRFGGYRGISSSPAARSLAPMARAVLCEASA
jgi:ADP-ribose pyrophosphatase YjhB (NUDIX family)